MSSWALLTAATAITVGSRVASLAVLPPPRGAGAGDPRLLAATACAIISTRWSSLLITLAAGRGRLRCRLPCVVTVRIS